MPRSPRPDATAHRLWPRQRLATSPGTGLATFRRRRRTLPVGWSGESPALDTTAAGIQDRLPPEWAAGHANARGSRRAFAFRNPQTGRRPAFRPRVRAPWPQDRETGTGRP